jgi:4-hydroxybenzoate polyprenyltransferase/phosphoserine phosphatase
MASAPANELSDGLVDELSGAGALDRPLCVDLDGTLVRTDTLWESVLVLVKKSPWLTLLLPLWLLRGRAGFKRAVADRAVVDPATLPYRAELVEMLRAQSARGRRIVLSTAADKRIADRVAEHLGFFAEVLATDGDTNLKGAQKRKLLEEKFAGGFDYVGDSGADVAVMEGAARGFLVGAGSSTVARVKPLGDRVKVLSTRRSRLRAAIKALRVHQWSKNALVVVPLLLAPGIPSLELLGKALRAALCLSFCASAGYVFNDLMDVAADRAHHSKHKRPFASGDLPILYGPPMLAMLFFTSFGLAWAFLPLEFVGMLAAYFVITLSYSFYLKQKLLVDVVTLAWLYTHRVIAGGFATGVPISAWLLAFSMFMFLSLAFAKRYIELRHLLGKGGKVHSRGYYAMDLEMVASMGPTAGYLAVLVLGLYIEGTAVSIYPHPTLLWFACPVLLYWISRVWFLAHRGELHDDPVKFAISDRRSWACAAAIAAAASAARFWRG